jgi:Fe2+ or Zn2+ uptake regulation protein
MEGKDLRKAGLKVTLPRLKILEILERSGTRHLSAEEIFKRLIESNEDIGLATVYRVLTQFEGAGLVARHHFEDGMAVFELNQGTHHDHIVCMDCGAGRRVRRGRRSRHDRKRSPSAWGFGSKSTRWCSMGAVSALTARPARRGSAAGES